MRAIAAVFCATLLASCGSRNIVALQGGHLIPTPDPLNLGGIGANYVGTIVVTDNGYSGSISVASTCASGSKPIAQVSPTSGSAPLTVTVTPQNVGTCSLTFSDSNGLSHTSTVNVTTSGIGVSSGSRK